MPLPASPRPVAGAVDDQVIRMFASRGVVEHVVRGIVGLVLVVAALAYAGTTPWALLLVVPAVLAWRGCPTCWAMGLAATVSRSRGACRDGRCG